MFRTRAFALISATLALIVASSALTACRKANPAPGSSLPPVTRAADASGTAPASVTESAAPKATTPTSWTASSTTPKTPPAPPTGASAKTMTVRVRFWNDTIAKRPNGIRILVGTATYSPDASAKSTTGSLRDLRVSVPLELVVLPDGPGGKRITVPFTLTPQMLADSDQDAIHIEVTDTTVRVLGNAVQNFDVTLPRF